MSLFNWAQQGIQSNLIASAIAGSVVGAVGYVKVWLPHIKPHIQKTAEIHRHLDPGDDWHIGDS